MSNKTNTAYNLMPKKNAGYRVFAALLALLAVGVFFIPDVFVRVSISEANNTISLQKVMLFDTVMSVIKGQVPFTWFGFLPSFYHAGSFIDTYANGILYYFALSMVLTFLIGFIAIFCKKKSPAMLRTAAFFFATAIFLLFSLELTFYYQVYGADVLQYVKASYYLIATVAFALFLYFILGCIKLKKKVWMNLLNCLLAMLVIAGLGHIFLKDTATIFEELVKLGLKNAKIFDIIQIALGGFLLLAFLLAAMRFMWKKGLVGDMIRYIIMLLVAGFVLYAFIVNPYKSQVMFMLSIVVASAAFLQFIICIIQIAVANKAKKKAKKAAKEVAPAVVEPVVAKKAEPVQEAPAPAVEAPVVVVEENNVEEVYVREEYAEAVAYEGGLVEGVEVAEEVLEEPAAPAVEAAPAPVETADYDYYNSKSFDPFIATLTTEERNQFTQLYILNYKGTMAEIPAYQVGGNNKEFFRKVFIYLGQYRDRIPDELLSKMYEFAIRL